MLPKVATHFLHTTSRAAAQAVQTPLRNVLQTGSSSSSNLGNRNGAGGSNWGGHGAGTGSTKQNTGSRYYSSFNTAGRAVSQANAVSAAVDGTFSQSDENDEHLSRRVVVIQNQSGAPTKRPRIRSSSVSLTKAESLGVLKTLQLHGRSKFIHTAIEGSPQSQLQSPSPLTPSRPRRNSTSSSDGLDRPSSPVRSFTTSTAEPESQLRRRDSTSSIEGFSTKVLGRADDSVVEPARIDGSHGDSVSSVDEGHEQSETSSIETKFTTPPQSPQTRPSTSPRPYTPFSPASEPSEFPYLVEAHQSHNVHQVAEAVARFRSSAKELKATTRDFNLALDALWLTRKGESAMPMMEIYNDMIKFSVRPDLETYHILLNCLTDRDFELGQTIRLLLRHLRRFKVVGGGGSSETQLQNRLDILQTEYRENYASAMSLYSVTKATTGVLPAQVYIGLLRACAHHQNVDGAVQIFRHIQTLFPKLGQSVYRWMINAYAGANNITGAEQVFQQYVAAGREGNLEQSRDTDAQKKQILVWESMISAYFKCGLPDMAIDLLDQMVNSTAGRNFTLADTPLPSSSIYQSVLSGFLANGDLKTAMTWFYRLREQGVEEQTPHQPSEQPVKPDTYSTVGIIDALIEQGDVAEVNKIFTTLDFTQFEAQAMVSLVFRANLHAIKKTTDVEQIKGLLRVMSDDILPLNPKPRGRYPMAYRIVLEYLRYNLLDDALNFYVGFFEKRIAEIRATENSTKLSTLWDSLKNSHYQFSTVYFQTAIELNALTFDSALEMIHMSHDLGCNVPRKAERPVLHAYGIAKRKEELPIDEMKPRDWEELLRIAVNREADPYKNGDTNPPGFAFDGILSLVEDIAKNDVSIKSFSKDLMRRTIQYLFAAHGPQLVTATFETCGPEFRRALEESGEIGRWVAEHGTSQQSVSPNIPEGASQLWDSITKTSQRVLRITIQMTSSLDEILKYNNDPEQLKAAYQKLKRGLQRGTVPNPRVLGRMIQGFGRHNQLEKVQKIYGIAQEVLPSLQDNPEAMRTGWICVEDSMVIALAHAGQVDNAHVHRLRLIEQGASPSADAYGALILSVKDTTDDASNAMILYREAQESNVPMNIYLYNNIISKLAKARKADEALVLFQKMKDENIRPTSITYGALIGACARVGDVESSEALFNEMVYQRNFKPRVPPFNTMMQLYTMTKPNREKALWFYEQMVAKGVAPTEHTYKLLLDTYGSIEPVDIASMEAIFERLKNDPKVRVQGTHYASLINAYGCVQRDLDKAIAVFYSVPTGSDSSTSILDAVVFEAIINALVSHRRTDLIPVYIEKMTTAGVHMTAYVVNFLIKGYSNAGELDKAREIFESLADPPIGMAAPNNHAPHDPSAGNPVDLTAPVYREPSTWEAMVRAELGAGHRDRAYDLLERLKSRQYPEAVYNRISGVMVDHSSLPPVV